MAHNHVITFVTNTDEFLNELEQMAPSYVITDDELVFIQSMTTIKSLGTYDELFANEEAHALYKAVYQYDVALSYVDEDGNIKEYFRPQKIGEFAA